MDDLDKKILKFLQGHGFEAVPLLSSQLSTGERTIQRRLKNMRDKGAFKVIAVPNLVSLGYRGWAKIGIKVDSLQAENVANALADHPNVYLVTHALGLHNIVIAVAFKSIEMLTHFVGFELNNMEGILSKDTMLFARPIKYYRYNWPGYSFRRTYNIADDSLTQNNNKYSASDMDMAILRILMADGLARPAMIKEKLGISEGTIRNRINFMKGNNLITLEVIPNKDILEGEAQATIDINTKFNFNARMLDTIVNNPNVYLVSASLGRSNLAIAARFENIDLLSQFISLELGSIAGIGSIQTSIHCKPVKIHQRISLMSTKDGNSRMDNLEYSRS